MSDFSFRPIRALCETSKFLMEQEDIYEATEHTPRYTQTQRHMQKKEWE